MLLIGFRKNVNKMVEALNKFTKQDWPFQRRALNRTTIGGKNEGAMHITTKFGNRNKIEMKIGNMKNIIKGEVRS